MVCEPLWWQAGRFVELRIETEDQPLRLTGWRLRRTGFPLSVHSRFISSDRELQLVGDSCLRTLGACMHETYMDCPYWEQLQYLGDTRLQILMTYALAGEKRLPRKALKIFTHSLHGSTPFPASNFPSRSISVIPPFALWWILMVEDYALWIGDKEFVKECLPLSGWILDHFLINREEGGLIASPRGWNFIDGEAFPAGESPGTQEGRISGALNWQFLLALESYSRLLDWTDDSYRRLWIEKTISSLARALRQQLWDRHLRAFREVPGDSVVTRHSQILAVLTDTLSEEEAAGCTDFILQDRESPEPGFYFKHYLFEALGKRGEERVLMDSMELWKNLVRKGFLTFPEHDALGRSDCHAWSAHPLYHFLTNVAGIRPEGYGFSRVLIRPLPGSLDRFEAELVHPKGKICLESDLRGDNRFFSLAKPAGLPTRFLWRGSEIALPVDCEQVNLETRGEELILMPAASGPRT